MGDATDICIDHQSDGCQCATGIEVVNRGNIHDIYRDPNDVACSGDSCLGECEGDCDTDEHCKQGLACWHRSGWDDPVPPGCTGTAHFQSHDYCYDPSKASNSPLIRTASFNPIKSNVIGTYEVGNAVHIEFDLTINSYGSGWQNIIHCT